MIFIIIRVEKFKREIWYLYRVFNSRNLISEKKFSSDFEEIRESHEIQFFGKGCINLGCIARNGWCPPLFNLLYRVWIGGVIDYYKVITLRE